MALLKDDFSRTSTAKSRRAGFWHDFTIILYMEKIWAAKNPSESTNKQACQQRIPQGLA